MNRTTFRAHTPAALLIVSAAVLAVSIAFSSTAQAATWSTINLHPTGTAYSRANGIRNGQTVGDVNFTGAGIDQGAKWGLTAASFVNMGGFGINRTDGVQQVGSGPEVWTGTPGSMTYLGPSPPVPNYFTGEAFGVFAGEQVGAIVVIEGSFVARAAQWTGTGASYVSLHPAGSYSSIAYGTHFGQQAGLIGDGVNVHASVWYNSAASVVDIHPAGATRSEAYDVYSGRQAGYATIGGVSHAGAWASTAASFIDLHPAGATESVARSIYNGVEVGSATFAGVSHAGIWNDSAGSWFDLSPFLPVGYSDSYGEGIWTNNAGYTYVAGWAINTATSQPEAFLWTDAPAAVPEPGTVTLVLLAGALPLVLRRRRSKFAEQKRLNF